MDPPIVEIAFTLTFADIAGPTIVDLADLYNSEFAADYPTVQQQMPLGPIQVGPTSSNEIVIPLGPAVWPRLWLIGPDTRDLVQIQSNRLSQNWRRIGPFDAPNEYPGYETVRTRFERSFTTLTKWLGEHDLKHLPLQAAELMYSNAIPMQVNGITRRISDVLSFYKSDVVTPLIGFNASWWERVPSIDGFVLVSVVPGHLPDATQALQLQLAARFPTVQLDLAQALSRFDIMHDKIHEIFARIVTPEIAESAKP